MNQEKNKQRKINSHSSCWFLSALNKAKESGKTLRKSPNWHRNQLISKYISTLTGSPLIHLMLLPSLLHSLISLSVELLVSERIEFSCAAEAFESHLVHWSEEDWRKVRILFSLWIPSIWYDPGRDRTGFTGFLLNFGKSMMYVF